LDQAPADYQNTTLEEWMQTVAAEFNLSETAFVWPLQHHLEQQTYGIRFFTPTMPVALCGHATLAAASILYQTGLVPTDQTVTFEASQDVLQATCVDEDATQIRMVLPAKPALALSTEADRQIAQSMLHEAFGLEEEEILWLRLSPEVGDLLVQVASADWIRALGTTGSINYDAMRTTALPSYTRGIILSSLAAAAAVFTNPDDTTDTHFGSRFFAPKAGILEDPVTGSAQAILMPHYAHLLGASELRAEQWSSRGGWLTCRLLADKVEISGRAVTTLEGRLQ
jgi:PhzF family phenazine biosynthesis protein